MPAPTPVTLRDVARACGVHLSTISLALNHAPSIPATTRERVLAAAAELGYRPNVAARNLALRRTLRTGAGALPIAWINQEPLADHWRSDPEVRPSFEAARRRAGQLGYHLEPIWTREPGMTPPRVVQILRARGIEGVIFPVHRHFDFALLSGAWEEFSLVGLNDHRLSEWIDLVCPDYYRNADAALRRLAPLGFPRIGLALTSQFDAASNGLVHSCFLRHQGDWPARLRVPACFVPDGDAPRSLQLKAWLEEHSPNLVLCADSTFAAWARSVDSTVVWIPLHGDSPDFSSLVDEGSADIAVAAVECVAEKMRRFERGTREQTRLHLIRGVSREASCADREAESVVA